MNGFQTIAILLTFAATGSYLNKKLLRLPTSIGMMVFALLISWSAMAAARLHLINLDSTIVFVENIDFSSLLLHGMLSFLLFAGALHIDLNELRKYRTVVALLATFGVVIATFVTGGLVWFMASRLGFQIPYLDALLFGALISPTDPVAVLAILKSAPVSKGLRLKIGSESLLNDGVGVVIFLVLLDRVASPHHMDGYALRDIAGVLAWEGGGSIALGLIMGWVAYALLSHIDDYKTEILLTLAVAAGGYSFAEGIGVSAPITMVVAGLVIGNHGRSFAMSDKTRNHLDMFWELLDDILNTILFMLVGLEMMVIDVTTPMLALGLVAIIATLIGRFVSVAIPIKLMQSRLKFEHGAIRLMTWGGLRGGISIAMALSLPNDGNKNILLGITYITVVFSVLFQGTTFRHLVQKVMSEKKA